MIKPTRSTYFLTNLIKEHCFSLPIYTCLFVYPTIMNALQSLKQIDNYSKKVFFLMILGFSNWEKYCEKLGNQNFITFNKDGHSYREKKLYGLNVFFNIITNINRIYQYSVFPTNAVLIITFFVYFNNIDM